MTDHTPEPWNESTGEPDFKTNWPEELGYLKADDKKRAIICVNALSGIEDVEEFMEFLRQNLIFALEVKEYHEEESDAGGLSACQGYVRDALALFPKLKGPSDE